jgi:hypothetical protein
MQITSIHDSIATWRKDSTDLNYVITYPRGMSNPSISTMCPAVTAESSMSFKASSSLQVATKPSPAASKLARGYKDFKMLRVRLADYLMLARIISKPSQQAIQHLRISGPRRGLTGVEECYHIVHHHLQGVKLGIRLCEPKRGQKIFQE